MANGVYLDVTVLVIPIHHQCMVTVAMTSEMSDVNIRTAICTQLPADFTVDALKDSQLSTELASL